MGQVFRGIVGKDGKSGNRDFPSCNSTPLSRMGSDRSDCWGIVECQGQVVPITLAEAVLLTTAGAYSGKHCFRNQG